MVDMQAILSDPFFSQFSEKELYDPLTHAASKETLLAFAQHLIDAKEPFAFFFIDFDNFKKINDTLGHMIGDRALLECLAVILKRVGRQGLVGRYGGDEFAVVAPGFQERQDVWQFAHDMSEDIRQYPIDYLKPALLTSHITLTIGISRFPKDGKSVYEILDLADRSLYRGKEKGKNCFIIYDPEIHKNIKRSIIGPSDDLSNLIHNLFELFEYEPLYDALKKASDLAGSTFKTSHISYFDDETDISLYESPNPDGMTYKSIAPKHVHGVTGKYRIIYFKKLDADPETKNCTLAKMMNETRVQSMILFHVVGPNGKPGYYRVDSRRERIWRDDEILIYQAIADLYIFASKKLSGKK